MTTTAPTAFAGPYLRALTIAFHLPSLTSPGNPGERLVTLAFMESVPVPRVDDEVSLTLPGAKGAETNLYRVSGVRWHYGLSCPAMAEDPANTPAPSLTSMKVEVTVQKPSKALTL